MNKGLRSDWKGAKQNKATKDRRKEFARRGDDRRGKILF